MREQGIFLLAALLSVSLVMPLVSSSQGNVLVVEVNEPITQATVELIRESIADAKIRNSEAIVLTLSTSGGGLDETKQIIGIMDASDVPVIGYVYPKKSAAWSAGTFILIGTHIAAMANYTTIGSCQPVEITAYGSRTVNESKVINALVEWAQGIARAHKRNESAVEKFIKENLNMNETDALKNGVIEFVSPDIQTLLKDINGTKVMIDGTEHVLNTDGAAIIFHRASLKVHFLKAISHPAVGPLLLTIGIIALIFGISTPGFGAEVFGIIAICLALISMGFYVNYLAVIFLIIGSLLLLIEIFVTPGFGFIGTGGIICLIVGSIFLIPSYPEWMISEEYLDVLAAVLMAPALILSSFLGFALFKVLKIRKKRISIGEIIGEEAITVDEIRPKKIGYVRYKGELWKASADKKIDKDRKVLIKGKDGHILKVEEK